MECKSNVELLEALDYETLNRTILECKSFLVGDDMNILDTLNRTILECKLEKYF